MKSFVFSLLTCLTLGLSGCGGGGDGGSPSPAPGGNTAPGPVGNPTAPLAANEMRVTVSSGPAELAAARISATNYLYASVTLCAPGTATCQTIDNILVDTGSVGLRVLASKLTAFSPAGTTNGSTSDPLRQCGQFLSGYTWGSVKLADVQLGSRRTSSVPIQLIGDPAAGAAPSSCASGSSLNSVVGLAANGILGIGHFLQDCGTNCTTTPLPGTYYTCPTTGGVTTCRPVTVPLDRQIPNPVALMTADNNGVIVKLPSVPPQGASSVTGSLIFGINTQANNALATAQLFTLNPSFGTLATTSNGVSFAGSFIDSGSNAYYFDAPITRCLFNREFYCPATPLLQTFQIQGLNGARANVSFTVAEIDSANSPQGAANPSMAGVLTGTATNGPVDFGLPFFYGRPVYVLFEKNATAGVIGPAVGF